MAGPIVSVVQPMLKGEVLLMGRQVMLMLLVAKATHKVLVLVVAMVLEEQPKLLVEVPRQEMQEVPIVREDRVLGKVDSMVVLALESEASQYPLEGVQHLVQQAMQFHMVEQGQE